MSEPGDWCEVEADRMADAAIRGGHVSRLDGAPGRNPQPEIGRYLRGEEERAPSPVMRDHMPGTSGRALDAETREFMESRFHHDFSGIRVHTDAGAAESASVLHAHAYTIGRDIVFGYQQYAPWSEAGRRLLAHELAHVVQRREIPGSTASTVRRKKIMDEEVGGEEDMEAGAELEEEEPDMASSEPDGDKESREVGEARDPLEKAAMKGSDGDDGRPIRRRRKVQRSRSFSGRGTGVFGGMRGKYLRHWSWLFGAPKTKREPSTKTTREVELRASGTATIPLTGDSNITMHGALFYNGEPIAGQVDLSNFESDVGLFVDEPNPSLAFNESSSTISVERIATGSLTYRIGDASDPTPGPRARLVVKRNVLGAWVDVYDTGLVTTRGAMQTVNLDDVVVPDAEYRVCVEADYWKRVSGKEYKWGDGRTQVDYALDLNEEVVKRVQVTKTVAGKSVVTKKARRFTLRL
jgi:hypothetical protein